MAEYNPFDVERRKRTTASPFGMSDPNPTGIPDSYAPPTGGINPDGMYSGTGIPSAPAASPQPSSAQYAMPGWDQTKWSDPSHTTAKYTVGRILSQYGASPEALQQALPQIQQAIPGATLVGVDSLNIPGIGVVDVGGNFKGEGSKNWWWGPDSEQGAGGSGTGTSSGMGGGAFGDSIRAKIQQLMNPGNAMSDPVYQQAMGAYNTQAQRGMEDQRNAIAERMAASGQTNSGAMDSRLLGAEQAAGEAKATFAGNLGIRALEGQRDQIMQALQIGAGLMTDEQRLALTEKLGLINASLQQQGITNQNNQYNSNMGWEQAQYTDTMNRIPWQTLFGA